MIDFSRKVLAYTHGLDKTGFVESGLKYDATLRNLELISEAATRTEVSQNRSVRLPR